MIKSQSKCEGRRQTCVGYCASGVLVSIQTLIEGVQVSGIKQSNQLSRMTKNYRFEKNTDGMSPAHVYKLIGRDENLYLKISGSQYYTTIYDVEREKEIKEKMPVPEVLHFEQYESTKYLLMCEVDGLVGGEDYE